MPEAHDQRSQVRELAFCAHYAAQMAGLTAESALKAAADVRDWDPRLIRKAFPYLQAHEQRDALDERLAKHLSANWPLSRLGWPERILLRQAAAERLLFPKNPLKVTVAETLKLTEHYGGEGSVRFVHGVLGNLLGDLAELPLEEITADSPAFEPEPETEEPDAESADAVVEALLAEPEPTAVRWQIRSGPLL